MSDRTDLQLSERDDLKRMLAEIRWNAPFGTPIDVPGQNSRPEGER